MKIVTLRPDQFEKFASNHRYRSFYQTTEYANVMSKFGYSVHYLGVVSNANKLIGASLLIYKEVFMGNKMAYAPRGILFNYDDADQVQELGEKLKKVLGKQGFMLLRIDPYIPLTVRDNMGNIMNFNNSGNAIIENLKASGFEYKGKTLFFETEKPRWEALILLNRDIREIFAKFDKRTRNKIRKATNNGIIVEKDETKNVNKLYEYVGKKEGRPISYYKKLVEEFNEKIDIYYAKLNTEDYLINSRRAYEKEVEYNENLAQQIQDLNIDERERQNILNKKMESDKLVTSYRNSMIQSTNLMKQQPGGVIIAGAMVMKFDNAAYLLTEGMNEEYSYVNPNHLIKWKMIQDYNDRGFKYINLNGIVGDFENENEYSGLNEMKSGFNSIITEYIGEFDIILNNFSDNLYTKFNKK